MIVQVETRGRVKMRGPNMKSILTDSHFLVPLVVFLIGLGLLIVLH